MKRAMTKHLKTQRNDCYWRVPPACRQAGVTLKNKL